jgi:hypothetical protein
MIIERADKREQIETDKGGRGKQKQEHTRWDAMWFGAMRCYVMLCDAI